MKRKHIKLFESFEDPTGINPRTGNPFVQYNEDGSTKSRKTRYQPYKMEKGEPEVRVPGDRVHYEEPSLEDSGGHISPGKMEARDFLGVWSAGDQGGGVRDAHIMEIQGDILNDKTAQKEAVDFLKSGGFIIPIGGVPSIDTKDIDSRSSYWKSPEALIATFLESNPAEVDYCVVVMGSNNMLWVFGYGDNSSVFHTENELEHRNIPYKLCDTSEVSVTEWLQGYR